MLRSDIHDRVARLNQFHIILILTFLGLLAYASAVNHPFVHDDVVFIQHNPYLGDLNLKNIFLQTSVPDDRFPLVNQYYRPLLELVNRVLYRVVRLNPHGFHFFNVLLHIANGFLVYNLLRLITAGQKGLPLAAAVLFLVHPVQSEAVACISGASNLVFAFLCLMSFYGYLTAVRTEEGARSRVFYVISLMLFFLALLAKEQSVVLPFLIVVYELCFGAAPRKKFYARHRGAAGFFIVLAGYFLLRKALFGFALTPVMDSGGELWLRLLAIPRSLLTYFGLMFFPHDLHYYRSQDILLPFVRPLLLTSAIAAAMFPLIRRTPDPAKRRMIFGLEWFAVSLLPTLNIVPLINEYSKILTAEHFLYFPLIGMILFVTEGGGYWIGRAAGKKSFLAGCVILGVITVMFTALTVRQNTYWRGEIPLFERTLRFEKDFGRAHFLLAKAYSSEGRFRDALAEDRKALAVMEGYARKVSNEKVKAFYLEFIKGIRYHMGYCLDVLGDPAGSLVQFKKALELAPGDSGIHYAVGLACLKTNDIRGAVAHFEKAVALDGNNLMAMNSLAICYQETGKDAEAERLLRVIAEKDSGSVSAKQNLENFLRRKGPAAP